MACDSNIQQACKQPSTKAFPQNMLSIDLCCTNARSAMSSLTFVTYAAVQGHTETACKSDVNISLLKLFLMQTPLVGQLGQSTIQKVLSVTENPGNAIGEIQIKASLRNPQCRPLLSLLDDLGVTRYAATQHSPTHIAHITP